MMSEQLLTSTTENENSQPLVNNLDPDTPPEEELWSFKIMSQYAKELICFLAFFLTTYATFHNRTYNFAKPPAPSYLFNNTSTVREYIDGQLSVIQTHVASSELALVFFYAPWCAESRLAKTAIEFLAKKFSEEVYFAAVNCWQPGGECKLLYPKVDSWPILMAYYPQGLAVQYNGFWNLKSVASFLNKLLNPLERIETKEDLLKAKLENYAVIIGYFSSTLSSGHYQIFFQAAVKSAEHYSLNKIKYVIATGNTISIHNLTSASSFPSIEIHSLRTTSTYNEKLWSVNDINDWIKNTLHNETTWIEISDENSWKLLKRLKKQPMLLMSDQISDNARSSDEYSMLKRVAYSYKNCNNISEDTNKSYSSQNEFDQDIKGSSYSLQKNPQEMNVNFIGIGCKYNRTLSFVMVENDLYEYMMNSQMNNVKTENILHSPVIIDNQRESIFQMNSNFSIHSVTNFIENYHNNSLSRNLRRKISQDTNETSRNKQVYINEINLKKFEEIIEYPRKNTIILFYSLKCTFCNLFSKILLNLLDILKSIDILRIDGDNNDLPWHYTMDSFPSFLFVSKRGETHVRIFPRHLQISSQNVLRFILSGMRSRDRLRLLFEICQQFQVDQLMMKCLRNFRIEILNCVSETFHRKRSNPNINHNFYLLNEMYFLTFQFPKSFALEEINHHLWTYEIMRS